MEENREVNQEIVDLRGIVLSSDIPATVTDPIAILNHWMDMPEIPMHGPEHHTLDGAALLLALDHWFALHPERASDLQALRQKRAGKINERFSAEETEDPYQVDVAMDLPTAIDWLINRAGEYPGGACGSVGVCGAVISCGAAFSIFSVNTPYSEESWSQNAELTSRIIGKLATTSGPRCCKRNAYFALETTVNFLKEKYKIDLQTTPEIKCHYFDKNEECLYAECPFF